MDITPAFIYVWWAICGIVQKKGDGKVVFWVAYMIVKKNIIKEHNFIFIFIANFSVVFKTQQFV